MTSVVDHLLSQPVPFVVLPAPRARTVREAAAQHDVDLRELVRTDVIVTSTGPVYLAVPAGRALDVTLARSAVGESDSRMATHAEIRAFVPGCEVDGLPPLSQFLIAPVFVDTTIAELDQVVFPAGRTSTLICMQRADLFNEQPVTVARLTNGDPALASIVAPSRRLVLTDQELVPFHLQAGGGRPTVVA